MLNEPKKKLSIILFSGDFDKIHYGLVTASAAAAINIPVTLFFTMAATKSLIVGTMFFKGGLERSKAPPTLITTGFRLLLKT